MAKGEGGEGELEEQRKRDTLGGGLLRRGRKKQQGSQFSELMGVYIVCLFFDLIHLIPVIIIIEIKAHEQKGGQLRGSQRVRNRHQMLVNSRIPSATQ